MQRTTSYDFDVITGPSTPPPRPPQPQPAPSPPRGEAGQPAGNRGHG